MKKLLVILFILPFYSYSQINVVGNEREALYVKYIKETSFNSDVSTIEGSPYLDDDFYPGVVYLVRDTIYNSKFRYNIYNDEIEFSRGGKVYAMSKSNDIKKISFKGNIYVYFDYENNEGYFEVINNKYNFYKKYIVKYYEKTPVKPIVGSEPARFELKAPEYFFLEDNEFIEFKLSKRGYYEKFPDKKQSIKKFVKENSLSFKDENDINKILEFVSILE